MSAAGFTRLSVNINEETANALRSLTAEAGVTYTETVRRAISVYRFLQDQRLAGSSVYVGREDEIWKIHFL